MEGFFQKLGRFIVNILIIILIVMISVQLLMKNETAYQRIADFELALRQWIGLKRPTVEVSNSVPVAETSTYLYLDLLQGLSLPQVWVKVNGHKVASFRQGIVKVEVKEGDLVSIDASNYPQPLWFEITGMSSLITSWDVGTQFRIHAEEEILGIVNYSERL